MEITPVVLVSGVAPDAMASLTIALQWDLPNAVVVQHRIEVERSRLIRVVSDVTGVIERQDIDLEHACVGCAIREDVAPALARLASAGRWDAIVAHLPVGAEAVQVSRVVAQHPELRHVRIAGVVAAVDGTRIVDDLLGDELLCDRGHHTAHDDRRGVAEVGAAQVEYADAVAVVGDAGPAELELVRALARPGASVLADGDALEPARLLAGIHDHGAAEAWATPLRGEPLPSLAGDRAWRLDLQSDRPFHPERLFADIEAIGGGPRRSRGCFWLPTRPMAVCAWNGAGGQLSIGVTDRWGQERPFTRIVVTGMDDGRDDVAAAFERCVLTADEVQRRGMYWESAGDGFEAWLGDIRSAL